MTNIVWKKSATAVSNGDFISIESYSGYKWANIADPEVPEYLLAPDVGNVELGHAILNALSNSRILPYEKYSELCLNLVKNYQNWVTKLQGIYGYKTKNALFKRMMSCGIDLEGDLIIIRPSNHEKLEGWSGDGIRESDYVKIPADSPPEEIGAGLRLAFQRCRGHKPLNM